MTSGAPAVPAARRSRVGLAALRSVSRLSTLGWVGLAAFLAIIVAVVLTSVICLVLAFRWLDRPFPGILLNERVVPGNVGRYEWTGTVAGLRYPDQLLEANGHRLATVKDLDQIVQSVDVGTPITYRVQRKTRVFDVTIPTMRFTWMDLFLTFGIMFLPGLVFCCLGVAVFLLKPNTPASWAFLLTSVCLGVYGIVAFDVQSTHRGFVRVFLLTRAFLPAAITHLSLVFPERPRWVERRPWVHVLPYVASAVLTGIIQYLYPRPSHMLPAAGAAVYLFLSTGALVASSLTAYLRGGSGLARQRAKVVLFGAALAFPIPALAHYLSLAETAPIQVNFLAIPLLIFPAAIAYAIARHNLFDVDVYIKRALGYGIMTAIVAIAYFAMQTITGTVLVESLGGSGQRFYPFVLGLLVVFFFNPLDRKTQALIDRIFFRRATDYKKTVSSVSDALTSMLNREQIIHQVLGAIKHEMFVNAAGVITRDRGQNVWHAFFVSDADVTEQAGRVERTDAYELPTDDILLTLIAGEKKLLTTYDIEEDPRYSDVREACLQRFDDISARVAIPLLYHGEVSGALTIGDKKSGHFYNREDIDLLSTMANQAAVAIQNANTHEEVVRYAEELAASLRRIQVLESIKTNLAKFVPKTVQQLIEESPEAPSFAKQETDVSVVFADITGYTRLSAQMELDQVNRLVERYFGAFLDEIVKYGGDVNETVGDGLMVIFRDSDPHRHAQAAVLAALGIQRRTAEINAELQGQFEPIEMHVGVNSGIASVGATKIEGAAGTRWTYTASGPTTNVAARLAALGEVGAVILSEETRRRLGDEVHADDLGPQPLKNVAQPVRVYRIKASDREPLTARGFERRRSSRQSVSWPVRVWIGDESFEGRGVDASVYGICVASVPMALLEPGRSYTIEILHEGGGATTWVATVRSVGDRGVVFETKDALPIR